MKKNIVISLILVLFVSLNANSQIVWSVKSGVGTSWIIFPKVFLVDPEDVDNVWEIGPGANHATFSIGGDASIMLGDHWFVGSGLDYNYSSGRIKVTSVELDHSSTRLQTYSRLEVPLIFGVKSSDDFWVTFGPGVFFNIGDNEGLKKAIDDLSDASNVNTTRPVGVKVALGIGISLGTNLYIDINFDSDYGKKFDYENEIYEIRLSMQSLTVGVGWTFTK